MSTINKRIGKRKLQIILSLIVAAVLSVTFLSGTVAFAFDDDFSITPTVKNGKEVYTVDVEVKNKGKAFDGRVVVMCCDNSSGYVGYSREISIASQATEYVSINVPTNIVTVEAEFYIYICDKKDEVVYREKFPGFQEQVGFGITTNEKSISNLDYYNIEDIQGYMETPAGELSGVISLIIILYIAIIGPGIYLLLKAINKRELLWIVIPGVTIVFVLIMFLMGLTTSAKGENVKSIELNNYTEETTKSYIFGYSSSPGKWTIKTKENYCSARVIMQSNYGVERNGIIGEIEEGLSNMRLSYSPKRTYQTVSYELKSESKPTGSIEIKNDFTVQDTIKVTNNTGYDLDYLYVSTLFGYDILENVKSGETRDVSIGVPSNNSAYGGQSFNKNGLERDEIRPAYESGDYDKASELAAIVIGLEATNTGNEEATAIGVTRGPSKTDKDEPSYKCFYTSNVYSTYEEY